MTFGYPFSFEAPLDRFGVGRDRKVWYTVLFLPDDLAEELPFRQFPRLRIEGEIAEVPVEGAWMPTGDGRRYIIVAPRVLRDADVGLGELVEMRFRIADQEAVNVPAELASALAAHPAAQSAWDQLTAGKRRALAYGVHGAKGAATRAKRVNEVIAVLTA